MPHPWEKKWSLGERLGKGGQGVTCKVTKTEGTNIHGALKYLKNNHDPQARGRMLREVASLQALSNLTDAVPSVLDHNTNEFKNASIELFVVMDLIPGPTLRDYVGAHGPLDLDIAIQLVLSICRTIEIAHSLQILHRDLKPENIIVRNENVEDLVIVDYGLSFNATDEQLTETNETFRNRFLDLPETNTPSGDRRDQRSDITAVCAILYFCLTTNVVGQLQDGNGAPPHFREGYSIRSAHPDDARNTTIEHFLTKGFSLHLENRYQSVSEIVDYLSQLVGASKKIDESDPIQVAAAMSDQIRASDRKTQLGDFVKQAEKLFSFLQQEHGKYHQKLTRFTLSLHPGMGGERVKNLIIPDELDLVKKWQLTSTIQTTHHPQARNVYSLHMTTQPHCQTTLKEAVSGVEVLSLI